TRCPQSLGTGAAAEVTNTLFEHASGQAKCFGSVCVFPILLADEDDVGRSPLGQLRERARSRNRRGAGHAGFGPVTISPLLGGNALATAPGGASMGSPTS